MAAALGHAGGYELLVELAAGGMATVYLARAIDNAAMPLVAVKRPHKHLASDKTYLSMVLDEARVASRIKHPNVVHVRELGFEEEEPFIVLDYVEGASLSDLRKGLSAHDLTLDPKVSLRIILDALAGLHAAHVLKGEDDKPLGIIHRDISPHNILVGVDGRARVTDFGIAKAEDRIQVTRTHEVKGKLAYLAPERVDKRRTCTVQSDVFAMSVCLWECVAGRRLFRGEEAVDTLQEVMHAPIPRLRQLGAHVSPALDDVIMRGLSRDLETRWKTAADFARALEGAAGRAGIATPGEVGRVVEAVFAPRLRARHEKVRKAAKDDAERLFAISGLPKRPPPPSDTASVADAVLLAAIGTPAPSARYSFGPLQVPSPKKDRSAIGVAVGIAIGVVLGVAIVFALARKPAPAQAAKPVASQAPTMTPAPAPSSPSTRRVLVTLPFIATEVALDGAHKILSPAADVAVFDLPIEAPQRHQLEVVGLDGTRANGFAAERDGIAQPEPGLSFEIPQPLATTSTWTAPPSAPSLRAKPAGTTRNGFTKLR